MATPGPRPQRLKQQQPRSRIGFNDDDDHSESSSSEYLSFDSDADVVMRQQRGRKEKANVGERISYTSASANKQGAKKGKMVQKTSSSNFHEEDEGERTKLKASANRHDKEKKTDRIRFDAATAHASATLMQPATKKRKGQPGSSSKTNVDNQRRKPQGKHQQQQQEQQRQQQQHRFRRHSTGSSVIDRTELVRQRFQMVLDSAQKTILHHPSGLQASIRLYRRAPRQFASVLRQELLRVIAIEKGREPSVERLVQFFVKLLARLHSSWDNAVSGDAGAGASKSSSAGGAAAALLSSQVLDEDLGLSVSQQKQLSDSQQRLQHRFARADDLATDILQHLLRNTNVKSQNVRFRVCQILAGVVHELPDLDNALWDDIEEQMFLRMTDTAAMVRAEAARVMCRLQSPNERQDPVTEALLQRLGTDSSAAVRRAVLPMLSLGRSTIPAVLKRTRDVDASVRKQAFLLVSKVDMRALKPAQRLMLLDQGLNREQHAATRSAAASMLAEKWLPRCGNDVVKLVEELGVMGTSDAEVGDDDRVLRPYFNSANRIQQQQFQLEAERILERALPTLFDLAPHARPPFTEAYFDNISDARALVWRTFVQHAARINREKGTSETSEELEEVLPNISEFAVFIDSGLPSKRGPGLATDFTTRQFLLVAQELDYSDEEGRRRIAELIAKLLLCAPESLWPVTVALARLVWPDQDEFVGACLAAVSDITVPLEADSDDGELADGSLTKDSDRLERALTITLEMMQYVAFLSGSSHSEDPHGLSVISHLEGILTELVLPCIQNGDSSVRARAVRLLGVICSAHKAWCLQYSVLLVQVLVNDVGDVRLNALRALGDAIMCFGLSSVDEIDGDLPANESSSPTLKALIEVLKDAQKSLRVCGAGKRSLSCVGVTCRINCVLTDVLEVLCKLYFCGAIRSWEPLSKLFLMLFDPTTRAAYQQRFEEQSTFIGVAEGELTLWRLHELLDAFFKTFSAMPQRLIQVASRSSIVSNYAQDPKAVLEGIVLPVFRFYARNTVGMAKLARAPANAAALAEIPSIDIVMAYLLSGCLETTSGPTSTGGNPYHMRLALSLLCESVNTVDQLALLANRHSRLGITPFFSATKRLQFENALVKMLACLRITSSRSPDKELMGSAYFVLQIFRQELFPSTVTKPIYSAVQSETLRKIDSMLDELRRAILRVRRVDAKAQIPVHDVMFQLVAKSLGKSCVLELCERMHRKLEDITNLPAALGAAEPPEVEADEAPGVEPFPKRPRLEYDSAADDRQLASAEIKTRPSETPLKRSAIHHENEYLADDLIRNADHVACDSPSKDELLKRNAEMQRELERLRRKLEAQPFGDTQDDGARTESSMHAYSGNGDAPPPAKFQDAEHSEICDDFVIAQPNVEATRPRDVAFVDFATVAVDGDSMANTSRWDVCTDVDHETQVGTLNQQTLDGYSEEQSAPVEAVERSFVRIMPPTSPRSSDPQIAETSQPLRRSQRGESIAPAQRIVVAFSGFRDSLGPGCDMSARNTGIEIVSELGGLTHSGEQVSDEVTHVVCPLSARTLKTVGAAISGRWLVSLQWLIESQRCGQFVDEMLPGCNGWRSQQAFAFERKTVGMTGAFRAHATKRGATVESVKKVVRLGHGKVVLTGPSIDSEPPDILLVADNEAADSHAYAERVLTWSELFDFIQPLRT